MERTLKKSLTKIPYEIFTHVYTTCLCIKWGSEIDFYIIFERFMSVSNNNKKYRSNNSLQLLLLCSQINLVGISKTVDFLHSQSDTALLKTEREPMNERDTPAWNMAAHSCARLIIQKF